MRGACNSKAVHSVADIEAHWAVCMAVSVVVAKSNVKTVCRLYASFTEL